METTQLKRLILALGWKEIAMSFLILMVTGAVAYNLYGMHDKSLFTGGMDVWFEGDLPRFFENMTNRFSSGHYRLKVHPLLSLLTYPPAFILIKLGFDTFKAVQIVIACIASLWSLSLYVLLRLIGCLRFDALLLSVLGFCSAAALFWLSVPESYGLGSISIIIALSLAALANQRKLPDWSYVVVSAFSLSATVTNWMTGIFCTFAGRPWRRACVITLVSLALVTILWGLEKRLFGSAVFFIGDTEESRYLYFPDLDRLLSVTSAFFFHSMTAPAIYILGDNGAGWSSLSMQASWPGSAGILNMIGSILWAVLLGFGIWALVTLRNHFALRITLGLTIIGQLALHIVYGEETFLYSLHFLPLFVSLAALTTLTRLRAPAIFLVAVLIPVVVANNWLQFKETNAIASSPRQEVKNQRLLRPQDVWPRGQGHVVLALPGSREADKAYHEPGGSFSPGVGSFGVSLWLNDSDGTLAASSDTLSLDEIAQTFDWYDDQPLPQLRTETKYYRTVWRNKGWGAWQLKLDLPNNHALKPSLLIRSVGPAGGAIRELNWDGELLSINKRWALTFNPAPKAVHLGEESASGWKETIGQQTVASQSGWAFARIELDGARESTATIQDQAPNAEAELDSIPISAGLKINLPDPRFSNGLNAQIAHLMMGLVGNETRPGEPTDYPLAWQRDGAYVVVALARAGKLETARKLSKDFAEHDFFGGFGAEADAPGLAIWALGTVAKQLHREDYDRWLWPHINRKAGLIEKMLAADSRIEQPFSGPVVPYLNNNLENKLVAEPARDGLIIGRMDHHRPILFVNAVSYQGLMEAAEIASRFNHLDEANRWTAAAGKLKAAWSKAFDTPLSDNDRTYISSLWPGWIATDRLDHLLHNLDQRWTDRHDAMGRYKAAPLWTYFELAEAHQWLFLNRGDRVWSTIEWFWDHQSSPGLYTWWEGEGDEDYFGRWNNVRGWINPPNVTPHYWTAAEMALLQMDMLGYIDKRGTDSTLILGEGIPRSWLPNDMDVQGLRVGAFVVDWHWRGNKMKVLIHGANAIKAKLGSGFPANANLELAFNKGLNSK